MRVIITNQSLDRLEESLSLYIEDLGIPIEKVAEIKIQLFKRAKSLSQNPYKGQYEPYLKKLKKDTEDSLREISKSFIDWKMKSST